MNNQELVIGLALIRNRYPNFDSHLEPEEIKRSWNAYFKNDDGHLFCEAIKVFITTDTKGFPPNIGHIKDIMYKLAKEPELTGEEVWSLVNRAMSRVNPYDTESTKRAYEELPEIVRKLITIGTLIEWSNMYANEVNTVVKSNFLKSYAQKVEQIREYEKMPDGAKKIANQLVGTVIKTL